jgi:hypothetical protein
MPGLRSTVRVLLGVFALLVAMAWVPASAFAAGNVTITSAGPSGGNPYDLAVVADDANGAELSSMTVYLSGPVNYTILNMAPADNESDPSAQAWAATSAIPTSALPAGTYTITVDATDPDETDNGLTPTSGATLVISDSSTQVSVTPTQGGEVTEGAPGVTLNGTVTGTASFDGTTGVPIANATVNVSVNGGPVQTDVAQTGSNGSFSYPTGSLTQSTTYDFTVTAAGDGSYPGGDSGSVPVTAVPATGTVVKVTPGAPVYSAGSEDITFTGSVSAISPITSGGVPVTNAPVSLAIGGVPSGTSITTDGSGNFSYTDDGITAATTFDFTVAATSMYASGDSGLINIAAASTSISVPADGIDPPQVTQGTPSVTINGSVQITPPGGTAVSIGSGVPVNVSIDGGPVQTDVATTQSNGNFSYATGELTQNTTFDFTVASSGLYGQGDSGLITVPANPGATSISVSPPSTQVTLGSPSPTLTATVDVTPPGASGPEPIGAGIPVYLNGSELGTTNASSQVSYPAPVAAGTYSFSVPSPNPGDPGNALYLATTTAAQAVVTTAPATTNFVIPTSPVITFGSPSAVINGTVVAQQPPDVGGGQVDVGNESVFVNGGTTPITTQSNGTFAYPTGDLTAPVTDFDFTIPAGSNDLYSSADSGKIAVAVDPGQTELSVTATPSGPNTETFTSTVQIAPGGTTSPTFQPGGPGVPIDMSVNGGTPVPAGTTDSTGTFVDGSVAVTPGDTYTFSVPTNPLYGAASQPVPLDKETTSVNVVPTRSYVTEGSQTVTFNGTVQVTPLGGSTAGPPPVPVSVYLNGGTTPVTTTNAAGQFTYQATGISQNTQYVFSVAAGSTYGADADTVPIGVKAAQTRIARVSLSPSKLRYGQKSTLSGTLQYFSSSSAWTPLAHTRVTIAEGKVAIGTVTTGSSGTFTEKLPTTHGFSWSASAAATSLTAETTTIGSLIISVPMRVRSFSAALGVNGSVGITGCLQVTAPVDYGAMSPVTIQYSANGRKQWKTLGRLPLHNMGRTAKSCPHGATESSFSGSIRAALDSAYYRADFPATNYFQGAVSRVIRSWRYPTKITNFSVTPHTVNSGQAVTITGKLWHRTGSKWVLYAHRTIEILYNQKGTSFWSTALGPVRTNSKGEFRQVADAGKGNFVAIIYTEYTGSSVDLAYRTAGIEVTIRLRGAAVALGEASAQLPVALATAGRESRTLFRHEFLILSGTPEHTIR